MTRRFYVISLISFIFLLGSVVHAATDEFTIRTPIGTDLVPPTVPMGLTATPVATTQIDLTWSSSTDDVLLSGYQIFRDNAQVATTGTTTTYSDVGLTPNTTYTYYVTAFDAAGNVSASSTEVSTTTLALVSTSTPTTTPGGGSAPKIELQPPPIGLTYLEVIPHTDSAVLRYGTAGYVRSVVKWGLTLSYEIGSLAEQAFSRTHETRITDLSPGTTYQFTIEGENHVGQYGILTIGTFTTLPLEDTLPPANVENLRAYRDGDNIVLEWDNPDDLDFDRVRILRSDTFYPSDTQDGWFVYEDDGETARDDGAAVPNTTQFYTVFSYDENGNISSGAVVAIAIGDDGEVTVIDVIDDTLNPIELTFDDVRFIQDGAILPVTEGTVVVDGTKRLTVELPYESVPEHLKTILVTLTDNENEAEVFSFILRINEAKTVYTAVLAPFGVRGTFPFRISVFDFKTSQIGYASGNVVSEIAHYPKEEKSGFISYLLSILLRLGKGYLIWFLLLILGMLLLAKRLLSQRRAQEKRQTSP